MKHGYYCGEDHRLYAEGAILMTVPEKEGWVKAQFDNRELGLPAHSWTEYPAAHFRSLPDDERLVVERNEQGLWDLSFNGRKVAVNYEFRGEIDIDYHDIKLSEEDHGSSDIQG